MPTIDLAATLKSLILVLIALHVVSSCCCWSINEGSWKEDAWGGSSFGSSALVKKEERKSVVETEYGEVSTVDINDGTDGAKGHYHIEFITLEPNAIFLPVLLHAEMVLYVHTGSGRLMWVDERDVMRITLIRGDTFRLPPGTVFYVQSGLEPEREKLRIHAIFANNEDEYYEPSIGAYSSIRDLLRGFDKRVLQEAFQVPEEVIEELTTASPPPPIVHAVTERTKFWEWETRFLQTYFRGSANVLATIGNKKSKTYNLFRADKDVENCNGWSLSVTRKEMHALKGSSFGVFMVNLTRGSMMGPHWNPVATEVAIVLQGQGMVRVVCASTTKETECNNSRFLIQEGDVFVIPRFHPMAQMAFNNESLVFMGFTTSKKRNYPQFLVGKWSIFQAIDREVLAVSFNVSNTTVDQILLWPQRESVILECTSCAEEERRLMKEEIEREREEEEERRRKEEEEEARKREEEEEAARKREEEGEAQRKEEEEEARRQEEERRRRQEEEEARRREEEEARRKEKEEEARQKEEEEARRQEEEEARREEEEAQRREEEEARRRRQEEEEEKARREEEAAARREEEARRRRQKEEEARRRREEEEEEARQQEEKEARRREEEEAARRQEEEEQQRRTRRRREEQRRQEEERRRQEAAWREQEEARRQEEEMERRHREAPGPRVEEGEGRRSLRREEERRRQEAALKEQEEAGRQEEEMERRHREGVQ